MLDLADLPIDEIIARCQEETERYSRRDSHDPRYCYELFRRALAEQDQEAWQALRAQHQRLVGSWIQATLNRMEYRADDASFEDISQEVWLRLFRFIPPRGSTALRTSHPCSHGCGLPRYRPVRIG